MSKRKIETDGSNEEDDDYMSDKYLAAAAQSVGPKSLNIGNRRVPTDPVVPVVPKEKSRTQIEEELRQQGLSTAISSENKGFQMLLKMGFKEGSKLGVNQSKGLAEPLPIRIHPSRSGLGEEQEKKDKIHRKQRNEQEIQSNFQDHLKEKYYLKRVWSDLRKCEKICERLDRDKFQLEENCFWSKKKDEEQQIDDDDNDEEQDLPSIESKLKKITEYLREKHFYCIWCGETFENIEELEETCPGNDRDAH